MTYQKTACFPIPFIVNSPGVLYGNGLLQDTNYTASGSISQP